jgi:LDH2 family malate/lactate/ureidoglycolate dehydrogenase
MDALMTQPRFDATTLITFTAALFTAAGMPQDRSQVVGKYLVEGDLMGHDTHGMAQAQGYLNNLLEGKMPASGEVDVISDKTVASVWDGQYLSGVWLTWKAVDEASRRAKQHGLAAISIRRSHHIACLAAFLEIATDQGLAVLLVCSDPSLKAVAPFGATEPLFTPNPIAFGYPSSGDPVLIDISASGTTMGLAMRAKGEGGRLPGEWLIGADGKATDDPEALFTDPPGAFLPLGGMDRGHKGFGLGLMAEALTSGLNGFGRSQAPTQWGASVYVQVIDPEAFGGRDAFEHETGFLAEACRAARPIPGTSGARMPGDGALSRKRAALADGVLLHPSILPNLTPLAEKLGVSLPEARPHA